MAAPEHLTMEELDAQLKIYMAEWRQEKAQEAQALVDLKEMQIKNRVKLEQHNLPLTTHVEELILFFRGSGSNKRTSLLNASV